MSEALIIVLTFWGIVSIPATFIALCALITSSKE